ncbi:MAG: VWA domain-containing protein [Treponema sp.]|nr:VWA domain-containing protein [Treponema sp.]
MTFQNPAAFLLLLLIPVYLLLHKLNLLQKPSLKAVLGDWQGKIFTWNNVFHKILTILSKTAIYSGFVLAIAALSDPVIRHQEKVYTTRGTDILFVLDTSPSMVAKDVNGETRLQTAKTAVANLFTKNNGARCGLVAMGSEAAVIVPPTSDITLFTNRLQSLSEGSMGEGSAIGAGISTAVWHLVSSNAPRKCIILLTDGENNAGAIHPETAAEIAQRNGITLYVFGIGTKGTVPINYTDPKTGHNYSGYFNSDFDSASLKKIASIANGKYYNAATLSELETALDSIAGKEILTQEFTWKTVNDSYYKKFLFASLLCFAAGWFIIRALLHYKRFIPIRSVCFAAALTFAIIAFSGLSWGTYMVPVHKSSNAVSFVFDISNSMTAKDEDSGLSRLEAASLFAKKLLHKMDSTSVSVILSKGDGVTAVPLTEDFAMIESLLDVLSPSLMSSPGTSLGKGINAARNSFPKNISAAEHIFVFTDGEDNDTHLQSALSECIRNGIKVYIIGFGSENGAEVLAGDGKTKVHSSLQTNLILKTISNASRKLPKNNAYPVPEYVKASGRGTGTKLLSPLSINKINGDYLTYEVKSVNHFKLFLILGFICMIAGILFSEFKPKKRMTLSAALIILSLFTGCKKGVRAESADRVLKGTAYYHQSEYEKATAEFLNTYDLATLSENREIIDYSLYNISSVYIMQNETESALNKLIMISEDAPPQVKYASFFNAGVVYFQNGNKEKAAYYFRKALETDSSKVEAKINLELSLSKNDISAKEQESQMKPSTDEENDAYDMEQTLFNRIKENDKGQWKNSETSKETDLSSDY